MLQINERRTITNEVVEATCENLVLGPPSGKGQGVPHAMSPIRKYR
jgi:hypothetical protein